MMTTIVAMIIMVMGQEGSGEKFILQISVFLPESRVSYRNPQ